MNVEEEIRTIVAEAVKSALREYFGSAPVRDITSKEEYLDIKQVCEELKISKKTYAKYRKQGRIAYIHRGRKIYVSRTDLDAFQERNRINTK